MTSNLLMMSSFLSNAVQPESGDSSVVKPEPMLAGFPWVSAIVLYTLSWGWSLLRPNTLYWDDWDSVFDRSPKYIWLVTKDFGLAPWSRLVEWPLLIIGVWPVQVATFALFFGAGVVVFEIFKMEMFLSRSQIKFLSLLFLVLSVNHARISVGVFDYTTSYFLFFLGWLILVRYKSAKCFVLACLILFLSFKTHSFLFFVLLPFLHFAWLNKSRLLERKKMGVAHFQVAVIAVLPVLYVVLRSRFWPPNENWQDYQQPTSAGFITALWPMLIGLAGVAVIAFRQMKKLPTHIGFVFLTYGFFITALALFPYFLAELYVGYAGRPAFITVLEFRADWRSRHQLLMPLGLALGVFGVNELFNRKKKNLVVKVVLVISVGLNIFWGSQYFLMSHKQEQLVELFKTTKGKIEIASVEDQTLTFNGRESLFRSYEWSGFMTLAGISNERPGCEALPTGSTLTLKSDTPYLKALATRDLGLYFEVKPCTEVVAQNG